MGGTENSDLPYATSEFMAEERFKLEISLLVGTKFLCKSPNKSPLWWASVVYLPIYL